MEQISEILSEYIQTHRLENGDGDSIIVLDQIYQAYAESHKSDPPEIKAGFAELESFLVTLPLDDNNAVFNLCCHLCILYERKAFQDGLVYGSQIMQELNDHKAKEGKKTKVKN